MIIHAAEKDADLFRSENLHYTRMSFKDNRKEVELEIIDNLFDL
jgi:hypothetical protein